MLHLVCQAPSGIPMQFLRTRHSIWLLRPPVNPHSDVSPPPISPKRREATSPLTPRTADRGLGATGAVPIPAEMWQRHAPTNWAWVAASTPPVGATTGRAVTALARRMAADGLLTRLPAGHAPNARAFGKRKSATKGAFIVDARVVNHMSAPPTERLRLPSLEQMGATVSLMRHLQLRVYFTKLDISNMFYTCRTPQWCDSGIRVQIGDDVCGFPGLPFGWAHSPALAQELLGMYLGVQHPR